MFFFIFIVAIFIINHTIHVTLHTYVSFTSWRVVFDTHKHIFFKMGKNQRFTELLLESIWIKGVARTSEEDFLKQGIFLTASIVALAVLFFFRWAEKKSSYDYIVFLFLFFI